jgi:hypothetical protein
VKYVGLIDRIFKTYIPYNSLGFVCDGKQNKWSLYTDTDTGLAFVVYLHMFQINRKR